MEIKDFSKVHGISIDTLRYYDREGLLSPKRINGRRNYSKEETVKINNIKKLKAAGFSLRDIKDIYSIEVAAEIYEVNSVEFIKEALKCGCIIEDKLIELHKKEKEIKSAEKMLKKMLKKMEILKRGGVK